MSFEFIKRTIKDTSDFLIYLVDIFQNFLYKMMGAGMESFPYKKIVDEKRTLSVLANGPSLSDVIKDIINYNVKSDCDYMVMNFFANENVFFKIKPKYYCLADPMFFCKDSRYDKVKKLFRIMNDKVDWDLCLFVCSGKKHFMRFSQLTNPHIQVKAIYPIQYNKSNPFAFFLFKKGIALPRIGTVANFCIFLGINMGYKHINLFGVDMTFFDGICINPNNELCTINKHFYDNGYTLKPYIDPSTNKAMRLYKYIDMVNDMFKSHEILATYARSLNTIITNYSEKSMLDCYKRGNYETS